MEKLIAMTMCTATEVTVIDITENMLEKLKIRDFAGKENYGLFVARKNG